MRCPKCSYISFDHLDSCRKCRKNIAKAAAELNGAVFAAMAPNFLSSDLDGSSYGQEDYDDTLLESGGIDATQSLDMDQLDEGLEFEDVGEDSNFGMESFDMGTGAEEPAMGLSMTETEEDFDLGLDDFGGAETAQEPNVDSMVDNFFGADESEQAPELRLDDIDMSDLKGPQEEADKEAFTETLILDDDFADEAPAAARGQVPPVSESSGDLELEEFDLGMPAGEPEPAAKSTKSRDGVRTGTALDDFEIDLGDLLPKK